MSGAALGTVRSFGPDVARPSRPWRRRAAVVVALLAVLPLSGCVGPPPSIDPSGVDELQIPTPTPDPADFVASVDNPWFPLKPGTVWTYRSSAPGAGPGDGAQADELTRTVTDRTRVVAGVETVEVAEVLTDRSGRVLREGSAWFAQDAAGNVWAFGEQATSSYGASGPEPDRSWEAGVGGAQAGLMMPATPRLGDGYLRAYRPGVVEDRIRTVSLDAAGEVPAGSFDGLLELEASTGLDPGLVVRTYYAQGLGLLRSETASGTTRGLELLDVTAP